MVNAVTHPVELKSSREKRPPLRTMDKNHEQPRVSFRKRRVVSTVDAEERLWSAIVQGCRFFSNPIKIVGVPIDDRLAVVLSLTVTVHFWESIIRTKKRPDGTGNRNLKQQIKSSLLNR